MDVRSLASLGPLIAAVAAGAILLIAAVAIFVAFRGKGVLGRLGRAMAAGTAMPGQVEVERDGRIGEATVLDRADLETVAQSRTMLYHMGSLVLEVRLPGVAPYRAPCRQWFIASKWSAVTQGSVVPVRVDPGNPQVVFVDLAAVDRARENAEVAEREAHLRRQAELLGQDRR